MRNYIGKTIKNIKSLKLYDLVVYPSANKLCSVSKIEKDCLYVELLIDTDANENLTCGITFNQEFMEPYSYITTNSYWGYPDFHRNCKLVHRFKGKKPTIDQIKEAYNNYVTNSKRTNSKTAKTSI